MIPIQPEPSKSTSAPNIILKGHYENYLATKYSNPSTRRQYALEEKHFMEIVGLEYITPLTQAHINMYMVWINNLRKKNPRYAGFIKSYVKCYDPNEFFKIKIDSDRSRQRKALEYDDDFLTPEDIEDIKEQCTPYMKLMIDIYTDTGLRVSELLNVDLNHRDWDLNLETRHIKGIGKNRKEFRVHFSKSTAKDLWDYLYKHKGAPDPDRPFLIYKKNGNPYKNQPYEFWNRLKKAAKKAGHHEVHPHMLRHSVGHNMRAKGFDLELIRRKLRHDSVVTTQIYTKSSQEELENREDSELFK